MAPSVERRDLNGKILEMKIPTDMEMGVGLIEIERLSSKSPSKHCLALGQMCIPDCCLLLDHCIYKLRSKSLTVSCTVLTLKFKYLDRMRTVFDFLPYILKLNFKVLYDHQTMQCCYGA